MNTILNEREYAKRLEALPAVRMRGRELSAVLGVLAKYYTSAGLTADETEARLEAFLEKVTPALLVTKWRGAIERHIRAAGKYALTEIDAIPITKKELETIAGLAGARRRKVAFTLLCAAKLCDMRSAENNGWANLTDTEIFKLANVSIPKKERPNLIRGLKDEGLVSYSKKVDNLNLKVEFIDRGGVVSENVTDLRNLGYQYLRITGAGRWTTCEECGLTVRRRGNAHRFCPECAAKRKRRSDLGRHSRAPT